MFAVNECSAVALNRGRPHLYGQVNTLSLFRCDGCGAILLLRTHFDDIVDADQADKLDPKWIFELDDFESDSDFSSVYSVMYSTPIFQQEWIPSERPLSAHVPDKIKEAYQRAFKVRRDPNSFAVQIRRALEVICKDRGKSGKKP